MTEQIIFPPNTITTSDIALGETAAFGTPFYLYDANLILARCAEVQKMMSLGIQFFPSYAVKANPTKAILELIGREGFGFDASSLNEVTRTRRACKTNPITLTTQDVPMHQQRQELEFMLTHGIKYNACSMRQLALIADFAAEHELNLSLRIHPGEGGSGESLTRDTANPYASFGIHIAQLRDALLFAQQRNLIIDQLHQHIGSGGSPERWRAGVDRLLHIIEDHLDLLPDLNAVNLGGGLKVARMPDEEAANPSALGVYAAEKILAFEERTGRKLAVSVEPGSYLVANAGIIVTRVIDIKSTGKDGFNFVITDGGMELNSRPLMYGARHPFAVYSSKDGLRSTEFDLSGVPEGSLWIPVGRCCETGDAHSISADGNIIPRRMAAPKIGDFFLIGGAGAYTASMSPFNYNSYTRAPEVIKLPDGRLKLIRRRQTFDEMIKGEVGLDSYQGIE
ncbi:MAG: diaminopimelate decarboxylase [Anaerolineae bacterium]|jgi:diaminopimelate decarboxylase|nr:diaminopimelate decarboxylase [Anaerolineae bacterium]